MLTFSAGLRPQNAAALHTSSEVAKFLARTSGLNAAHTNAYRDLINGLVADNVWALLDALYILATADSTTALLNLVSTSFPLTVTGTPTFTADAGYSSGTPATNNLSTGFNPTTASSPKFTQNSASMFVWRLTAAANTQSVINATTDSLINAIFPRYTDDKTYINLNSSSDDVTGIATATGIGMTGATRVVSTGYDYYRDASVTRSRVNTSGASHNSNLRIMPGPECAAAGIGGGLTATQYGNLYNRVHIYMQTIAGAA